MNGEVENQLLQSCQNALDRVMSRLLGLQSGYILILRAISVALQGDNELKKDLDDLNEKLKPVSIEADQYFLSIIFLDAISEIEIYFSSIVQAVVSEHPKKLGSASFKLSEVIDSKSTHELVARASDDFVNKLMYKKPMEYLHSICDLLSIEPDSLNDKWLHYVEAKARRDLGTHNSWICNSTYLRKLSEADIQTDANEGDIMIPVYDGYVNELLRPLTDLVFEIHTLLVAKHA